MIINVDWKDFKTYIKIIHIKITQIEINFKKESDKDVTFFLKHFCWMYDLTVWAHNK